MSLESTIKWNYAEALKKWRRATTALIPSIYYGKLPAKAKVYFQVVNLSITGTDSLRHDSQLSDVYG